ncbi:long-chain fatty acid--CoA ligase, partial [Alphaproteobacteria bacterium]|nr:long-chain fatty acid--CoA ligase [Alphaproteobacteria bacterium]
MTSAESMFAVGEIEVRGETLKTFTNAPATLGDVWALASMHGDKTYLIYEDESWSYTQAYAETASIVNWMHANDIKQGDRVAIPKGSGGMVFNVIGMHPIHNRGGLGITVVGMNAWWVTDEMQYGLEDSAPKAFIADIERLERFLPVRDQFPDMKVIGLRLPEPVEGVIDYTDLKNHGGEMPKVDVDGD